MSVSVSESYRIADQVARTEARNFYYSFTLLPRAERAAMCAVYAFMRYADDLSDDEGIADRAGALGTWRQALRGAYEGWTEGRAILPAFAHTIAHYDIPRELFEALIDGVEMDLTPRRYATFDELRKYCYRVASVVGLVCLRIWGVAEPERAGILGESCGYAFQLTNIIRDIREDAGRGRIYIPTEALAAAECPESDLTMPCATPAVLRLVAHCWDIADGYFDEAAPLTDLIQPGSRAAFVAMFGIYRGVHRQIRRNGYDVFASRARLSTPRKIGIVGRAWLQSLAHRRPGV